MVEFKKLKDLKMTAMLLPFVLSLLFASTSCRRSESVIEECINFANVGDYQRAIESGKKAVKMFPKNVDANLCLGRAYSSVGEFKLALEYLKRAESLASDEEDLSAIYSWLGEVLGRLGDDDSALYYYSKKLAIDKRLGNEEGQSSALNGIAIAYQNKGEYDKALEYFNQALILTKDDKGKATIYNNIAIIYSDKEDYNKAIEYFQKAIELGERAGSYDTVAVAYINLGYTYIEVKNYALAEKYITEGLKRVQLIGDRYWEAVGYEFLGKLYTTKDKNLAIDYYTKAYNIHKAIGAESDAEAVKDILLDLGVNPDKPQRDKMKDTKKK